MSLRLYLYLQDRNLLDIPPENLQLYTAKGAATKIAALVPIDGDLLRLCGYYLAEGWISSEMGRAGAQRERIGFSFHCQETEYLADVRRILSRYGLKFLEKSGQNSTSIIVSSRVFAWLIGVYLGCGTHSEDKALPALAFNVPPVFRHEIIRGAFSGDGSLMMLQAGKNARVEYATVSKRLADGIALLLQSVGIISSIKCRWMNKSKRPAYILRVSGYNQVRHLSNAFGGKRHAQIEALLIGYARQIKQHGFSLAQDYALLKVNVIEREPVEQTTVYSLETETHTVIVGSGLVSSNCFPKDVKALAYMAQVSGKHPELLGAVMEINDGQRRGIIAKLHDTLGGIEGKVIGVLGLSFKENTDDLRESPALRIADLLHAGGAIVRGYDPVAMENVLRTASYIHLAEDAYDLARGCDALVVATPWNEFKQLDMGQIKAAMRGRVLIDGRNLYSAEAMQALGFVYRGVGRGYNHNDPAENNNMTLKA